MAATVSARQSTAANSPHLTSSPTTRANPDSTQKETNPSSEPRTDLTIPSIKKPDEEAAAKSTKDAPAANAPLAPPPKPNQNGDGDYYAAGQPQSHFSKEPNPFDNAFGNPADTPGKPSLPGLASLTSPAPLGPANTPGWPGSSLRSGPLSPAMLTGPTNPADYFNSDHHFAGSFPTPNESSLRTGLTPGGGGSMFPQPSPNSQALYNSLQSGGATPGTLDFHRTAMTARAQTHANSYSGMAQSQATSQPQAAQNIQPDLDSKPYHSANGSAQQDSQDPFDSHQTNDAANGLFMLAQAGGQRGQQHFNHMQQSSQPQPQSQSYDKHANKASIGSTMSGSTEGGGQYSDENDTKPNIRNGRGKKAPANKAIPVGKRKNEEALGKGQVNKKQRGSNGANIIEDMPDDDEDMDDMDDPTMSDKKMTDEEKRKNFLERNRVAALKCRQRKKQWLANLQQKVEIFSTENDALAATVTQLREEIVGLKTLLLAHKECPVSQAQGISGMAMHQITGDAQNFANPYGMAMGPGMGQQAQMAQGQMQRS